MLCRDLLVLVATPSLSNRQTSCFFADMFSPLLSLCSSLATTTKPSITQQKQCKRHPREGLKHEPHYVRLFPGRRMCVCVSLCLCLYLWTYYTGFPLQSFFN